MYEKKDIDKERHRETLMANEDWKALHDIGKSIESRNEGHLYQVAKDSPHWKAWRRWLIEHGLGTKWYDWQNADKLFTVTAPWPPTEQELRNPAAYIAANSKKDEKKKEARLEE